MNFVTRACMALVVLLPIACGAQQAPERFIEGSQYQLVRKASAPKDPSKIEVAEVFWYGCNHCFAFDPFIERWEKSKAADVEFIRIPNSLGRPIGLEHSKAYYTAKSLNVFDKFHLRFFKDIHLKRMPMNTVGAISEVFTDIGVDKDTFSKTFTGFAVDSQVRRAEQQVRDYGISSVPMVVVGGKYITSASMAGGPEQTLDVINFLVEKVRSERKK